MMSKKEKKMSGKSKGPEKKATLKKGPKTRKELRKDKRMAKNIKKQLHTINKSSKGSKPPEEGKQNLQQANVIGIKQGAVLKPVVSKQNKKHPDKKRKALSEESSDLDLRAEKRKLEQQMKQHRIKQLKIANEEEDKNIKRLEKMMKMNKRKTKNLPKAFAEEGLDYLLEVCDSERMASLRTDRSLLETSYSEFDDDLAEVMGEKRELGVPITGEDLASNEDMSDDDAGWDDVVDGDENEEEIEDDVDSDEVDDDEEAEMGSMEKDFSDDELVDKPKKSFKEVKFQDEEESELEEEQNVEENGGETEEKVSKLETWEDIYGRTRDKQGNVVQVAVNKYIPPALRATSSDSAMLARLTRQMQGLLNRVAESNMAGVASQMEQIISSSSRGDSNQVLGQLLHALAPEGMITPPRMVAEHILLLAILHAHLGTDIGATFLQSTVEKLDAAYKSCKEIEDKTLNNLLQILCFMYSFKIFHCTLLFDILEMLGASFEDKDVELILLILKTVGSYLRKDDPAALKNVIIQMQKQASAGAAENSRVAFMLDVLLAIKNNNMSKIPDYDPDLIDRMRKLLRALLRAGSSVSELKISLNDLLNAQQKGKWWVVGSAWQGAGPVDKASSSTQGTSSQFSQQLLDLARAQRMNTDLRRNVFCILMSAEDFIDAFEKLLHLGVKGQQERAIVYVILNCCLQEQNFNPYYAHLALKFCDYDRKFKMTIQCSIWDKIKEMQTLQKSQIRNLASFTSFLIINGGLTLAVLKMIQFADLDKVKVKFIRQVLLGLLLTKKEEECVEAFARVPSSGQLALFKEGMRLFLHRHILGQGAAAESDLLRSRVAIAERLLVNQDSKVSF